jgi:hypothetical protein
VGRTARRDSAAENGEAVIFRWLPLVVIAKIGETSDRPVSRSNDGRRGADALHQFW